MKDIIKDSEICILGIDLAKNNFQLHGTNKNGEVINKQSLKRQKLKEFMANTPPCLVGMEACGGSHYWANLFESYGHKVRLMAPQFVKPYVKSNKNDSADAEAICEAVQRPNMRFVSVKTTEQQDIQSLHRMRSLAVAERTSLINQTRGLLLEYGIVIPLGAKTIMTKIPLILEDGENGLSHLFCELLNDVYEELRHLNERIDRLDNKITLISRENNDAKILQTIPGVGPMIATALVAAIGSIDNFRNGRELAAWLGLVPRQHSTGGRQQLLGISKRGDVYIRSLLVHGARAVLRHVDKKTDSRSEWLKSVKIRRHKNVATVALANKMARTAFALLKKQESYQPIAA